MKPPVGGNPAATHFCQRRSAVAEVAGVGNGLGQLRFVFRDAAFPFTAHMGSGRFGEIATNLGEPCAEVADGSISFRADFDDGRFALVLFHALSIAGFPANSESIPAYMIPRGGITGLSRLLNSGPGRSVWGLRDRTQNNAPHHAEPVTG